MQREVETVGGWVGGWCVALNMMEGWACSKVCWRRAAAAALWSSPLASGPAAAAAAAAAGGGG